MLKRKCTTDLSDFSSELTSIRELAQITQKLYEKAKADDDRALYDLALQMSDHLKQQSERVYERSTGETYIDRAA